MSWPAGGRYDALFMGDSVMRGYGTLDGGDLLPAGVRVWNSGVESALIWPLGNGSPDDAPGYMRGIAAGALAAGYTDIRLHRWATNGQRLISLMSSGDLRSAMDEFVGLRDSLACVYLAIGTNNAISEAFTAEFLETIHHDHDAIQAMFPNAAIVHLHPIVVTQAGWEGADDIRAAITDSCAQRSSRAYVEGDGDDTVDINHPTLAVYSARGAEAFEAWAALNAIL